MESRRSILHLSTLVVLFLLVLNTGCLTSSHSAINLTAAELADQFLKNADAIRDYRSEYVVSGGTAENPYTERIRFDAKSPSFTRMEVLESSSITPGSFATTKGTSTAWYNAETRTYDISSGMALSQEYDYQEMVRRIVADRNFTIIEYDTSNGTARYLIEVVTAPWSDIYTPYISSRVRSWIEPSTGLAWTITTYYDCDVASVPTLPPGAMSPEACSRSQVPNREIQYESIAVNTRIPDSFFDFVPPEGSSPRCVPKYVNYVEPPRSDNSVPIDQPLSGGIRYSFNESDSGCDVTIRTGEAIEITLRTIPGLAFRWIMPTEGSGLELMNAGSIYEMPETNDFLSGRGYYRWRFLAVSPGTETFDGIFALNGCNIQNAKRFTLTVEMV